MSECRRLADQLEHALNGQAWHGPSWREALDGIGLEAALRRPVPNAHTIAEIVLHASTWHDVARRRFEGETPQVSDAEDWPRAAFTRDEEWQAAVRRFFDTGLALQETIARFPEERLLEERGGGVGTWYALAIGMLQHDLYHAGQVALLRKASTAPPA